MNNTKKIFTEEDIFSAFLNILEDANQTRRNLEAESKELQNQQKAVLNILEDLETKKTQIETILNTMTEGLVMVNKDGNVIYINPAAKILLDIKDESKIYNKNFCDIIKVDKDGELLSYKNFLIFQTVNKNLSFNIDALETNYYFTTLKEKRRLVALNVNPLILNAKVEGAVLTFRDAASEKEIDRMKTEFVSVASHQLRTPLTAIKWFLEILSEGQIGKLEPGQLDMISQAYSANERMIDLVNALLNVSRIESRRIGVELSKTDILKLINEIAAGLKHFFDSKKQEFVLDLPKSLPIMETDPKLLRQIFENLLSNANKYTPEKGKIIFKLSKKNKDVLFEVSDNGYGIPKNEQENIFKKFFRASNIFLKEPEGSGLGLYIVKSFVELLGGKIWFESEENKGTTFYVSLPIKK